MILESYLAKIGRKPVGVTTSVLVLAGVTLLAGLGLWQERYFSDSRLFLAGSAINMFLIWAAYRIDVALSPKVTSLLPDMDQSIYRVALWFGVYGVVNVAFFWVALPAYHQIGLIGAGFDLFWALRVSFFILSGSLIAAGLTELAYAFRQWRTNQNEVEQMQEKQLQTELEAVKQQVNPHFLFNCLNSLSVLITDAPGTAEKFVDEMSKVYRYQLSVNGPDKEDILVTLDSELRFIKSYIYLLETRFENGISITLDLKEVFLSGQMVPLTFQILIDHAIHYNMVSSARPLHISIATTETGQLEFRHNRQPKMLTMPPDTPGIHVLINRYKFLFNRAGAVQLKEDDHEFAIILPLIFT
ncbi:LytS/YehU family sensor histidine kinase [Dyadobacter sp. BE34]|uniref:LytS/YehU family sensor histidine kinase n=1 Tax=Dyadobacter fermentans TaxID=94254 RepID=A0ABU1QZQ8_9BACT|nr:MULTISPECIES: histidine kinase [Dyadobacter]MDR6806644.1 LytS/YehU family sensor histidine kinase [Dyadobacter fermentans]MDR7044386.1 LytS/YehU family sensor histidine kinase [Dyadobacter sp. BE242]MDR7198696.1 LytS/YehU family sensor histidine kinase [Dyadobacter sp. BE34]MDR7216658.1 LytS/YehU family sensor histidine kinase [Dyadobacter sp. BE31]MDR7263816.1 LytS/YehU family sensor histidine kinase [Dyadobacter sp. BE32]